jgi:hypothetical protein
VTAMTALPDHLARQLPAGCRARSVAVLEWGPADADVHVQGNHHLERLRPDDEVTPEAGHFVQEDVPVPLADVANRANWT